MIRGRRAWVFGVIAAAVAACASGSPAPSHRSDVPSSPAHSQRSSISTAPSPDGSPAGTLGDIGTRMDILALDAAFSARVLEFASTGSEIIASVAAPDEEAAPDLYAILPSTGGPSLLWRNPARDHSVVRMAGDSDLIAFVDMPADGGTGWTLRVIPDTGEEAVILDEDDGDPDVPTLVPSFSVYWPYVAWTAFGTGPDGPVSQLFVAEHPGWEPRLVTERSATDAELWFPFVYGSSLLYTELVYSADRLSDERSVWLTDVRGTATERLDTTGLATMPVMNQFATAWKEGDAGFHMLNWGVMEGFDEATGTSLPISDSDTNFPSAGERYMTWWRADSSRLEVWDAQRRLTRDVVTYDDSNHRVLRPHVAGGLLAWLFVDESRDPVLREIRFAFLP